MNALEFLPLFAELIGSIASTPVPLGTFGRIDTNGERAGYVISVVVDEGRLRDIHPLDTGESFNIYV